MVSPIRTVLSALVLGSILYASQACSCMPSSLESKVSNSANVFRGQVVSMAPMGNQIQYNVRVIDSCKMTSPQSGVIVTTGPNSAACGVDGLVVNQEYTFFADQNFHISLCSWDGNANWGEVKNICHNPPVEIQPAIAVLPAEREFKAVDGVPIQHHIKVGVAPGYEGIQSFPARNLDESTFIRPHVLLQGEGRPADEAVFYTLPHHSSSNFATILPYPAPQAPHMSLKSVEREICSLCDRLRGVHVKPVTRPMPMPIDPAVSFPAPMPEPVFVDPPHDLVNDCVCIMLYDPVCGVNAQGEKVTYGNSCQAGCEKAEFLHKGECGSEHQEQ